MTLSKPVVCLLAGLCLVLGWPASGFSAEGSKSPVAKVGNVVITQENLKNEAQKILPMQVSFHGGLDPAKIEEVKKKALDKLIERAYKVQYAIDEEVAVDAQVVEETWQNFAKRNAKALSVTSPTRQDALKADIYLELVAKKAESEAVGKHVSVSDEEVRNSYDENKDQYFRPELYTASHILVKVDPAASKEERAEKLKEAEEILARAKAGEDFYDLAYYESDDRSKYVGGSLGSFHAGQTVPAFEQAIQGMEPGEIAGPVQTRFGYHIIKLDDVKPERQLSFDEVAATIRTRLEKAAYEERYGQWMKELRDKYPLEKFE